METKDKVVDDYPKQKKSTSDIFYDTIFIGKAISLAINPYKEFTCSYS